MAEAPHWPVSDPKTRRSTWVLTPLTRIGAQTRRPLAKHANPEHRRGFRAERGREIRERTLKSICRWHDRPGQDTAKSSRADI
eukprot:126265-Prorocentrum_minimum.AAC.2